MIIIVEVLEGNEPRRRAQVEALEAERLATVLERVAVELGVEHAELILNIGVGDVQFDPNGTIGDVIHHGHHWHHRQTCVDLHFESESEKHHFSSRSTWGQVHHWGCRHFEVPAAVCANLQLHEDSPTGPVLNDRLPIGHYHGCKTIWLVKPGPEPNGCA
jgi:hypothetical protein